MTQNSQHYNCKFLQPGLINQIFVQIYKRIFTRMFHNNGLENDQLLPESAEERNSDVENSCYYKKRLIDYWNRYNMCLFSIQE